MERCWEDTGSPATRADTHQWKPVWEPGRGPGNLNGKWQIAGGSVGTPLRTPNSKGTQSFGEGGTYYETYLQDFGQVPTVHIRGKYPSASSRGWGEPSWNMPDLWALLNKAHPQEKVVNRSPAGWGVVRAWLAWGTENTQLQITLEAK